MTRINIIGIPTEAGTHAAGQRLAPQALLNAGLPRKLHKLGYQIKYTTADLLSGDNNATAAAKWKAGPKIRGVRNEENTLTVLESIYEELFYGDLDLDLDGKDVFSIFIGGDSTVIQPIMAALSAEIDYNHKASGIGLIYMSGSVDLTLPSEAMAKMDSTGMLDGMTMTHLAQRSGGITSMHRAPYSSRPDGGPLATSKNVAFYGFDPLLLAPTHWVYLVENRFRVFTRPTVRADPVSTAKRTVEWLEGKFDFIVLHLDVDVIDSGEFPLASYSHYAGLSPSETFVALEVFLASPKVKAMTITDVNPTNDADGSMVKRLVEALVKAFAGRQKRVNELQLPEEQDKRFTFGVTVYD